MQYHCAFRILLVVASDGVDGGETGFYSVRTARTLIIRDLAISYITNRIIRNYYFAQGTQVTFNNLLLIAHRIYCH